MQAWHGPEAEGLVSDQIGSHNAQDKYNEVFATDSKHYCLTCGMDNKNFEVHDNLERCDDSYKCILTHNSWAGVSAAMFAGRQKCYRSKVVSYF